MTGPAAPVLTTQAETLGLVVMGGVPRGADDALPPMAECLLLLGPHGPSWPDIRAAPEFHDGAPDPLNRWSRRVIGGWAAELGAEALYPFDGPPWQPFHRWALATGRAHGAPVGLLCHVEHGLMASFRGALALPWWPAGLAGPAPSPCDTCTDQPCRTACPADALTPGGYDVPACQGWLETPGGHDCRAQGCRVRRACPVSAGARRTDDQSAFHMKAFHP